MSATGFAVPIQSAREHASTDGSQARKLALAVFRELDPNSLADHIEALYRVARAMGESHEDAEDLVQDTFAKVLRRPRLVRGDQERGYLIRALRNAQITRYRSATRRPKTMPLPESHDEDHASPPAFDAREVMTAISTAPKAYRDAVVAVDLLGLSYRQAARRLRTREATVSTRLHRGRRHVVRALGELDTAPSWGS